MACLPRWVVGRTKYPKMVRFLGKLCLHGKELLRPSSTAPHCINRETEAPRDEPAWLRTTWERAVNSSLFIQAKAQSRAGSELLCAFEQHLGCSSRHQTSSLLPVPPSGPVIRSAPPVGTSSLGSGQAQAAFLQKCCWQLSVRWGHKAKASPFLSLLTHHLRPGCDASAPREARDS